jgi:hypothetical protein
MTMRTSITILALAMLISGCRELGFDSAIAPGSPGGYYELVAVDGNSLPCCAQTDSTGVFTIVSGSLTLTSAAPEKFAATPAGIMPSKCVQEVPNGAKIDQSGNVTLPDGSTYHLPTCAELHSAKYQLVLERRLQSTGSTVKLTLEGTYAWGEGSTSASAPITLINSGMSGSIALTAGTTEVRVGKYHFGLPTNDPQYTFRRTP